MRSRLIIHYTVTHYIAIRNEDMEVIMDKVCAFFGHREIWDDISAPLEQAIRTAIMQYGVTSFWVGGCGQFDAYAAGSVRRLKKEFPHIRLYLILAYLPMKKDPYFCAYDSTIYPEGLEFVPKRFAISKRNRWMLLCKASHKTIYEKQMVM